MNLAIWSIGHLAIWPFGRLATCCEVVALCLALDLARPHRVEVVVESERPENLPAVSELKMYPRHFGVTFRDADDFDRLYSLAKQRNIPFYADVQERFVGLVEVHRTFVLVDPSNNLLEFKHYPDHRMMY